MLVASYRATIVATNAFALLASFIVLSRVVAMQKKVVVQPLVIFAPGCCGREWNEYDWLDHVPVRVTRVEANWRFRMTEVARRMCASTSTSVVFAGHSLGGLAAMFAATRWPGAGLATFAMDVPGYDFVQGPVLEVFGSYDCSVHPDARGLRPLKRSIDFDGTRAHARVVVHRATHARWASAMVGHTPPSAKSAVPWCTDRLGAREQQTIAAQLLAAFAFTVVDARAWVAFERLLQDGAARGVWSYRTHLGSNVAAHVSCCPCEQSFTGRCGEI